MTEIEEELELESIIEIMKIAANECENKERYYRYLNDGRINLYGIGIFTDDDTLIKCECTEEDRKYVKNMLEKLCKNNKGEK